MNTTTILESSQPSIKLEAIKAAHDVIKFLTGFVVTLRSLLKYRPDLLYLTESALLQCLFAAKLLRIPVICELQAEIIKGRWGIRRALIIKTLKKAEAVFGITRFHVEPIVEATVGRDNIYVIPNTVDVDLHYASTSKHCVRSNYDIADHKRIVSYFGGVSHIKGFDLFLEFIKQITSSRSDVVFVFGGPFHERFRSEWAAGSSKIDAEDSGRLFAFVEHPRVKQYVRVIGEVTDVISIMEQSALIVAPNKFPHFSRTVMEAFYCSRPVVASDDKFNRELIDDGVNGMLAAYDHLNEWVAKANRVLDNPELAYNIGRAGHKVFERVFSPGVVATQINTLFRGNLGEQRPGARECA